MGKWAALEPWDAKVLTALAAGEMDQAFDALFHGYQDAVVGYCIGMLGHGAEGEEVAQKVFLAAWDALPRFEQRSTVRTWLFAIARRQCLRHLGIRGRLTRLYERCRDDIMRISQPDAPDSPEVERLDSEAEALAQQRLMQLPHSLKQLRTQDRKLLMMRYYEDLSRADIAARLWVSETTVRRRLHTAEARLKQQLAREEEDA
jgi:RNA polymerase sigma-70 factor (ECF subfamily)